MRGLKAKPVTKRNRPIPLPRVRLTRAASATIELAINVIGSREQAMRWMGNPVRALDYATPISLLASTDGIARVRDVLGQMERGVW